MLLLCSFFRLKELFQVKNNVTTSLLFFFLKMPKIGVGRTTVKGEKKEDGHNSQGNSTVQKDSAMRSQCVHLLSVGGEE